MVWTQVLARVLLYPFELLDVFNFVLPRYLTLQKHSMTEEKCIDAIHSGDSEAVMRLVRSGVDINTRFYDGYTLLHLAVLYGNDSIAKDVLEYWTEVGGDVNVKTNNGSTPLHLAVTVSLNSTVAAALCRAGAALHARDSYGETPLELAIRRGYDDVADYLRQLAGAHAHEDAPAHAHEDAPAHAHEDAPAHAHEDAPALAADTDAGSVRLCYTRIQGSADQSGSSSATACLTSKVQTNFIYDDWLSDYIEELLETYDQPCHEEMRKWIIDEIPCLYGISPHAAVDYVDFPNDDEETATNGSSTTSGAAHSSYSRTLEDEIYLLIELFDKHEHEEIQNCVTNEIPRLIGMVHSRQAEDGPLMAARSLEIHRRLIEMSLTDDQSRQLLILMKKHQPVKEDDELEFVDYPSGGEENDTDDEIDGEHLERTEPSLQEPVTELEAL